MATDGLFQEANKQTNVVSKHKQKQMAREKKKVGLSTYIPPVEHQLCLVCNAFSHLSLAPQISLAPKKALHPQQLAEISPELVMKQSHWIAIE